jgi:hypothetical protein
MQIGVEPHRAPFDASGFSPRSDANGAADDQNIGSASFEKDRSIETV